MDVGVQVPPFAPLVSECYFPSSPACILLKLPQVTFNSMSAFAHQATFATQKPLESTAMKPPLE